MASLTDRIKERALLLGFTNVGIVKAGHLSGESVHLTEWLRRGYHGTMGWMEEKLEKRSDPRAILPSAQSVICLAVNYFTPHRHADSPSTGKISRYAWGDDYHDVVVRKLRSLAEFLDGEAPGSESKVYVDTGPLLEKALAARAGIGWQGKHTNLITKDYGSWVFLGEVITSLALDADEPMADFCGTCTACIDACPTDAIVEPYVLDSTKCISYLTIEHKGEIPDSIKPNLEGWVYGCDICQDVCPWNSFQQESKEAGFQPRQGFTSPLLTELEGLTREEFGKRFSKSPIKRTKHEGLMRNVKAVAGKK